jgi:uncharacterized phage protein (TIGR01671 family)
MNTREINQQCEIKFRGQRIDNGEWAYGYVYRGIPETDITYIMPQEIYNGYESHSGTQGYTLRFEKYCEVHPETVGQYTNILDKNGAQIFEGDTVKVKIGERYDLIGHVKYNPECGAYWIPLTNGGATIYAVDELEIIGNIHTK